MCFVVIKDREKVPFFASGHYFFVKLFLSEQNVLEIKEICIHRFI